MNPNFMPQAQTAQPGQPGATPWGNAAAAPAYAPAPAQSFGGFGNGGGSGDGVTSVAVGRGGGGGGAGGTGATPANGGIGGPGSVIVRYAGDTKGTGGTITSSGGYTYHTFTAPGTFELTSVPTEN